MTTATTESGSSVPNELMQAALSLPRQARARFASIMIESLDPPPDEPSIVHDEWKTEIARRIEEIRSGKVQAVDGHEMLLRMRREIRERYGL